MSSSYYSSVDHNIPLYSNYFENRTSLCMCVARSLNVFSFREFPCNILRSLTTRIFHFCLLLVKCSHSFFQVIHLKGDYIGDGITWPVIDGCDQYTLTVSFNIVICKRRPNNTYMFAGLFRQWLIKCIFNVSCETVYFITQHVTYIENNTWIVLYIYLCSTH